MAHFSDIEWRKNMPISYGAQDPVLDNGILFPSFYRTVPSESAQYKGLIQLLQHFSWNWVGLIASSDENNKKASEEFKIELLKNGICIEYFHIFSSTNIAMTWGKTVQMLKYSTAQVIIIFCDKYTLIDFLHTVQLFILPAKVWITSSSIISFIAPNLSPFNGSILFSLHKGEIPGLKDFTYSVTPSTLPDNIFTARMWHLSFGCLPSNYRMYRETWGPSLNCTGNETLQVLDLLYGTHRLTYAVYKAVYAMAHSLHAMLSFNKIKQLSADRPYMNLKKDFKASKLTQYLKNAHFTTTSGEEFHFENRSAPPQYDILNWIITHDKKVLSNQIGSFDLNAPPGQQLIINDSAIQWNQHLTEIPPRSVCSESCLPGYRKAIPKNIHVCCYDCVRCSDGEISNKTDMENCVKCAEDQWSNAGRNMCISRTIEFLSYEEALGISLSSIAIVFAFMTLGVLVIFIYHRDTAIVKANNRNLSYTLLVSLTMCFLCSLLFVGCPVALTCFFRQAAFGIIFAVAVSSVLAKTTTVVIAFKATKPGSRATKWLGSQVSSYLVCLSSMGEALICLLWFICSPPFLEFDTHEQSDKMILQCNEGSVTAFYFVVGYIGLLAALSFIVAFLARKLPDSFNEATHITFSMLVFCIVWLSFIPAYLSTKGKYMVAAEIFAILASSAGLMGCIFIPKCYIIVIRPDLNTRERLIGKKTNQSVVDST
ncbi:vomeronasal type-2 receptor 26-like [Bombina bombina]|uniref:vomeronasal type-2 receptor 26-like n=1 Tax=Bombina bombina TaxID=8345 RepID=UPI00235B209C|nr:vomeronasal type-2 receptor 26-like [Bombina bombina]